MGATRGEDTHFLAPALSLFLDHLSIHCIHLTRGPNAPYTHGMAASRQCLNTCGLGAISAPHPTPRPLLYIFRHSHGGMLRFVANGLHKVLEEFACRLSGRRLGAILRWCHRIPP